MYSIPRKIISTNVDMPKQTIYGKQELGIPEEKTQVLVSKLGASRLMF